MNDEIKQLAHRYLDQMVNPDEELVLNNWIKANPENARAFAELVGLHDRLSGLLQAKEITAEPIRLPLNSQWLSPMHPGAMTGIAAVLFLALGLIWWSRPSSVSAATELDKLVQNADTRDRSYRIRNLDARPEAIDDRRPPIDGAELHVRHPDRYILIRSFPDGRQFVTGSDGESSWSIPPNGVVRVSHDPLRFRGPVPGHQQGIAFANLRSDLAQLRDAYHVTLLETNPQGQRGLLAVKKSPEFRGPNHVELWYDPTTGIIHRMVFQGMPRARGGPDSVSVELLTTTEKSTDYFTHAAHHTPDRRVIEED
ncbi:MAG: hypothetical protein U0798_07550 [Gemmataceae bacterium]